METKGKIGKKLKKILSKKYSENYLKKAFLVVFLVFPIVFVGLVFAQEKRMKIRNEIFYTRQVPSDFEKKLTELVGDHPIKKMVPYIAKRDFNVAVFMIAIAKKESDWGNLSPKKDGQECFNYWGYRGPENTTDSGYSCFKNYRQAVKIVGDRIAELIDQKIDTPSEMVIWKCGWDCSRHDPESVSKWISDVKYYYQKLKD